MNHDKLSFYWTVASHGSRKALQKARADPAYPNPERVMVAFTTQANEPWPGPSWFIDSGGYTALQRNGRYETTPEEFVSYLAEHEARDGVHIDAVALRDWLCEESILDAHDRRARVHQNWTIRDHIECRNLMADYGIDADPVAVLQGADPDDYLRHADHLDAHGLLTDTLGVGSLKHRSNDELDDLAAKIREYLPSRHTLHFFGITESKLRLPGLVEAADSVDTAAWDKYSYYPAVGRPFNDNPLDDMDGLDRDDDGRLRNTWRNMRESYVAYRSDIADALADAASSADASQTFQSLMTEFAATGYTPESDPQLLGQCVCGGIIDQDDPGTHGPHTGEGCRHCEHSRETQAMIQDGVCCDPDLGFHQANCPHNGVYQCSDCGGYVDRTPCPGCHPDDAVTDEPLGSQP